LITIRTKVEGHMADKLYAIHLLNKDFIIIIIIIIIMIII